VPYSASPLAATPGLAPAIALAAGFLELSDSLLTHLIAAIAAGYQQAPVLVLVLSVMLVLPLLALVSLLVRTYARRKARRQAWRAAQRRAEAGEWKDDEAAPPLGAKAWPSQAWLTVQGNGRSTMPLAGQSVRIGRHEDNDIRLADSSVHRYHAVIQRTPEEEFVITDLSGKDGNGVRVNGARTAQARLVDGDVIELGRIKLKFESSPA
jgi:FHA domain